MKYYGQENKGYIKIQTYESIPTYVSEDKGKIIYVRDVDRLYYGGVTKWMATGENVFDTLDISTDTTLADDSDTNIPTEHAIKGYVDSVLYPLLVKGYKTGCNVTIKDVNSIYVGPGLIEINNVIYQITSTITIDIVAPSNICYLYLSAPGTGIEIAYYDFSVSITVPTYNGLLGDYYMTGDTTKRYMATLRLVAPTILETYTLQSLMPAVSIPTTSVA